MPWDRTGFTRTDGTGRGRDTWQQAFTRDEDVNAPDHDTHDQDIAAGIEACVNREGLNSPEADLPMAGHRHTAVGDALLDTQYASYRQLRAAAFIFVPPGNVGHIGGDTDEISLKPTPAVLSQNIGRGFRWFIKNDNTGPVWVTVSGLSRAEVKSVSGQSLPPGQLLAGDHVIIVYTADGSFRLVGTLGEATAEGGRSRVLPADWALRVLPTGTAPSERIAADPGEGKVLFSGAAGGDAAEWRDPFSAGRAVAWGIPADGGFVVWSRMPRSLGTLQQRQGRWRNVTKGDSAWTYAAPVGSPWRVDGQPNGDQYEIQLRGTIKADAAADESDSHPDWCQWSESVSIRASATPHAVHVAGTTTFIWPWDQTQAYVTCYGGGGGGGGYNQNAGGRAGYARPGADGGESSVVYLSQSVRAPGGKGGNPGGYFAGHRVETTFVGNVQYNEFFRIDADTGWCGGNAGRPGGTINVPSRIIALAQSGMAGMTAVGTITGLTLGASLTVVVGAGGSGGSRGTNGNPPARFEGGDGGPGSVIIYPVP